MEIKTSKLKAIEKLNLKQFTHLKYLFISFNELEVLTNDLFEYNSDIRVIYATGNKIKFVGEHIFDNLKYLETVFLSSNTCIHGFAETASEIPALIRLIREKCLLPGAMSSNQRVLRSCQQEIEKLQEENFQLKIGGKISPEA